jgi:nucleotide-binding universal stress UspA family protein
MIMKRILVPLDGTALSASIIEDARELAGPGGELVLIHDVLTSARDPETGNKSTRYALDQSYDYLERLARGLRNDGVKVRVETLVIADTAIAIDEAARIFNVDMIACVTHGRSPLGRLIRGGVAWRAVTNSPVPVLLRHVEDSPRGERRLSPPRILVPLDGSGYSETALPVAAGLAEDWNAEILLVQVVPELRINDGPLVYGAYDKLSTSCGDEVREARDHLLSIEKHLPVPARIEVCSGPIIESLVGSIGRNCVTHVILASHGRTGLSRVILGSVADALVHQLHCPIIVIPALAAKQLAEDTGVSAEAFLVGGMPG